MRLYKKFRLINRETYRLNYICHVELNEKKIDYSEYGHIRDLHEKNFDLFIDYNVQDVRLITKLNKKFDYISLAVSIAYMTGVNFTDAFGSVLPWDCLIHHKLMAKDIAIPFAMGGAPEEEIIGGYVKEPSKKRHPWLVSLDFNSLYPHIMMLCNIGPDTFYKNISKDTTENNIQAMIEGNIPFVDNHCLTANFCLYSKHKKSFYSEIMGEIYSDRKKLKKEMIEFKKQYEQTKEKKYDDLATQRNSFQNAYKILLNSGYGAAANKYFRYYDSNDAEAVTSTGQAAIQFTERRINEYINKVLNTNGVDYIVASDTDSLYLNLSDVVNLIFDKNADKTKIVNFLDKFSEEELQPIINKACDDFAKMINAYEQKLIMKREKICSSGIWTAKKKYVLDVWDEEGVRFKEPEIKVSGLEVVRSSSPEVCRNKLKEALRIILREDEIKLHKFVSDFRKEFMKLPIVDISFPRGLNDIEKWMGEKDICNKGTPIHVRGAIFFNAAIKNIGLEKQYPLLTSRDKIKFVYLIAPNPLGTHVVSYKDIIPPELNLDKYIDYNIQFEKAFLQPLKNVLNVVGWSHEKRATLTFFD
jgi:DNA polymerase elongation subunit (family B)